MKLIKRDTDRIPARPDPSTGQTSLVLYLATDGHRYGLWMTAAEAQRTQDVFTSSWQQGRPVVGVIGWGDMVLSSAAVVGLVVSHDPQL